MKNLRHRINNYESAISPNLFSSIMLERNKKKQDSTVGFWVLATSIFALLALATFQFSGKNNSIITNTISASIPNNTPNSKIKSKTHEAVQIVEHQDVKTTQTVTNSNTTPSHKKHPNTILPSTYKNQSTTIAKNKTEIPKSLTQNLTPIKTSLKARTISVSTPFIPLPTLLPTALLSERPEIKCALPNNDCYTFNGRSRNGNSKIFIDLLGSPDYVKSSLAAKASENQAYQKNRVATENYEFSYSGQFGIGLETGGGIVIRSGVNYSQYESRFRKSDPDYKKVTIEQIFDNQGNPIRIDTVTTYGTLDIQHFNTHKYIGIPLTLGYTTSGRKLDIGINVGAQFNIQTISKGRFIGADFQTTDFTLFLNSNQPVYKTQIGVQGLANLTFAYEVGDHFDLIFAPHVKFTPKAITTKDYPLTEKLMTTGLWIGGRIRF